MIGVEVGVDGLENRPLAKIDDWLPETFRETCFPVSSIVRVGEVGEQKSRLPDFHS